MRKLVKIVSSVVVALSFAGFGAQAVNADTVAPLGSAETAPTNPAIAKGQKSSLLSRIPRSKQ